MTSTLARRHPPTKLRFTRFASQAEKHVTIGSFAVVSDLERDRMERMDAIASAWREFCRQQTEDSFALFHEASKALVWSVCYRVLRNEEDASDAFQSTYLRLFLL